MKKQFRTTKLTLNSETIRALSQSKLTFAQGGRIKEETIGDPGATIEGCEISAAGNCVSGWGSC